MSTSIVSLDTTQYVKVNAGYVLMLLQAHRDSVRIAMSTLQPALDNKAFHTLGGGDNPLKIDGVDVNVWALAMTDRSSLIVTEFTPRWHDVVPSITVTDIDHRLIHEGLSFIYSDILQAASSGGTKDILLVNTTTDEIHLKDFSFTSSLKHLSELGVVPTPIAKFIIKYIDNHKNKQLFHCL